MAKENLLKIIDERNKSHDSVLVSVEEFFKENNNESSFAANACGDEINIFTFYKIFIRINELENTQNIWILIVDIDEDWPYSDTVFIHIVKLR